MLALLSASELGSSVRCRLVGLGRAGWWVLVVPLFSQGSVLTMTIDALEWRGRVDQKMKMKMKDNS